MTILPMKKAVISSLIALSVSSFAAEVIKPDTHWRITDSGDKTLLEVVIDSSTAADLHSLSADKRPDNYGQNKARQDAATSIKQHVQIIDNRIRQFLNLGPVSLRLNQSCSLLSIESPQIPAGNIVLTPAGVTQSEKRKINIQVLDSWLGINTGITNTFCDDIKNTDKTNPG